MGFDEMGHLSYQLLVLLQIDLKDRFNHNSLKLTVIDNRKFLCFFAKVYAKEASATLTKTNVLNK